mmetsp:Transcript_5287/g.12612  ORF Transcript_5287/g.12612 Transcript_5287/m.12612 type:complete len:236 (-) Transcript_5287:800-1507(-)
MGRQSVRHGQLQIILQQCPNHGRRTAHETAGRRANRHRQLRRGQHLCLQRPLTWVGAQRRGRVCGPTRRADLDRDAGPKWGWQRLRPAQHGIVPISAFGMGACLVGRLSSQEATGGDPRRPTSSTDTGMDDIAPRNGRERIGHAHIRVFRHCDEGVVPKQSCRCPSDNRTAVSEDGTAASGGQHRRRSTSNATLQPCTSSMAENQGQRLRSTSRGNSGSHEQAGHPHRQSNPSRL